MFFLHSEEKVGKKVYLCRCKESERKNKSIMQTVHDVPLYGV